MRKLRIHGDNIVECERALNMITDALQANSVSWVDSPLHAPTFELKVPPAHVFSIQLFPGYGRWQAEISAALTAHGAPLAEAADALITELQNESEISAGEETILVAIEFCGALPAGNNAWQRCGRSYSYAVSGVPYLYVSELGGYELDSNRSPKAARLPNPLVPFSYITQSQLSTTFALPVYVPSPTIDEEMSTLFKSSFGWTEALQLIAAVIMKHDYRDAASTLADKGVKVAAAIAKRQRASTNLDQTSLSLLMDKRGLDRARHLVALNGKWSKSISISTTTTFSKLLDMLKQAAVNAGSSNMPFAIISASARPALAEGVKDLYQNSPKVSDKFVTWLADTTTPMVIALIAGFKPKGADSRPDRGLLPLVRMMFGDEVPVLSIIYGPATTGAWKTFAANPQELETTNGLWKAVLRLSDAILVDSTTSDGPGTHLVNRAGATAGPAGPVSIPAAITSPNYSEHDVDTIIKMMAATEDESIFEGLCNPPGGDWSGISLMDVSKQVEHRWTSLPRVSGHNGKRPDHILQFIGTETSGPILSIESKDRLRDFEPNIGPRLIKYVYDLLRVPATITRDLPDGEWKHNRSSTLMNVDLLSVGAFIHHGSFQSLAEAALFNKFDIAFAVTFSDPQTAKVSILHNERAEASVQSLARSAERLGSRIEVEIHGFGNVV